MYKLQFTEFACPMPEAANETNSQTEDLLDVSPDLLGAPLYTETLGSNESERLLSETLKNAYWEAKSNGISPVLYWDFPEFSHLKIPFNKFLFFNETTNWTVKGFGEHMATRVNQLMKPLSKDHKNLETSGEKWAVERRVHLQAILKMLMFYQMVEGSVDLDGSGKLKYNVHNLRYNYAFLRVAEPMTIREFFDERYLTEVYRDGFNRFKAHKCADPHDYRDLYSSLSAW